MLSDKVVMTENDMVANYAKFYTRVADKLIDLDKIQEVRLRENGVVEISMGSDPNSTNIVVLSRSEASNNPILAALLVELDKEDDCDSSEYVQHFVSVYKGVLGLEYYYGIGGPIMGESSYTGEKAANKPVEKLAKPSTRSTRY